jgi:hypothetical protein
MIRDKESKRLGWEVPDLDDRNKVRYKIPHFGKTNPKLGRDMSRP